MNDPEGSPLQQHLPVYSKMACSDRYTVSQYGSLGPSFVIFFLGHLERYKFFQNSDINPKSYARYVDDIFALLSENVFVGLFFNLNNQQHPEIKFTVENSENNIL